MNKEVKEAPGGGVAYKTIHSMQIRVQNGINPLIIVNGQEIGHGIGLLNNILVDEVETLESLSEDEAVAKYGVKGKDGAYVVTTKKK